MFKRKCCKYKTNALNYPHILPFPQKPAMKFLFKYQQSPLHSWQSSLASFSTWPLQSAPLTAFTSHGLNLLTSAQVEALKTATTRTKQTTEQVQSAKQHTSAVEGSTVPQLLQPQGLTPQPYFILNSPFYTTPLTQYAYTTTNSNQFFPHFFQPLSQPEQEPEVKPLATTKKPKVKDTEPTTKRPKALLKAKPPKLQVKPKTSANIVGGFLNDKPLLQAVKNINSQFVVEEIMPIPGRHIFSSIDMETIPSTKKTQAPKASTKKQKSKAASKKSQVKVEATGRTATSGNIPEIPFGTYFLPYFSEGQQQLRSQRKGVKTAALILEPHSKAIVGNGGTAISSPISRAFLKRGVATNVYFNPESVAIAGVGGKAHAQADLELDLID